MLIAAESRFREGPDVSAAKLWERLSAAIGHGR
jgi:hypothetical protein